MTFEEKIFSKYLFNKEKLMEYGFLKVDNSYKYTTYIVDNSFKVEVLIKDNNVSGKLIDVVFDEEYNNFRIKDLQGDFVGEVRDEYEKVLIDIRDNCATKQYFVNQQSNRIVKRIKEKYNILPEFLWEKIAAGALRHNETKRWFGIIMTVLRNKITKIEKDNDLVDVINIKLDNEKLEKLLNNKGFYPAYHMNKKNWLSIILDNTLEDDYVMELIDDSFNSTL